MRKERGFVQIIMTLLLVLAVLGAIYALIQFVDTHWATSAGVDKGKAEVQARWDAANRKAKEEADEQRKKDEAIALASAKKLADAEREATAYKTKWREEREKIRGNLIVCTNLSNSLGVPVTPSAQFTWGFLRSYDTAWTDGAGKPILTNQIAASQSGPSPVDAERLLDVHGENASRCGTDRRNLDSLIEQVELLKAGWKQ